MKTIEEASYDALNESPSYVVNAASVFHEGFAWGVEFAQRWILVEEELPPINEVVLLKTDFNFIVGFYTGTKFRALTFSLLGIENLEINGITHWRPIEYK